MEPFELLKIVAEVCERLSIRYVTVGSIATVAYANAVPFIAFRSLSDLAGGGGEANQLRTFFQLASDNSAAVVQRFLTVWTPPR